MIGTRQLLRAAVRIWQGGTAPGEPLGGGATWFAVGTPVKTRTEGNRAAPGERREGGARPFVAQEAGKPDFY